VSDSIIQAMPDLGAFVGRDGIISSHLGRRQLSGLPNPTELAGRRLDDVWPQPVAKLLLQMVRRALTERVPRCMNGRYRSALFTSVQ